MFRRCYSLDIRMCKTKSCALMKKAVYLGVALDEQIHENNALGGVL